MLRFIKYVISKYNAWAEKRLLASYGCTTWKQYYKITDPDVSNHSNTINHFYHGYKYVFCCDNHNHPVYVYGPGFSIGIEQIAEWAETAIKDKWRYDFHRVLYQTGIGLDDNTEKDWYMNDIGGYDYYFFAFKNERDYLMFLMRWA